jgi:hypothetical protein
MHTEGFFHYTFKATIESPGDIVCARVAEISIRSGFDQNKSWRRSTFSETKALLEHEQGHLDINELHAFDFKSAQLPTGYGLTSSAALEDLKSKLEKLCDKCSDEAKKEQNKYDDETEHGGKADEQTRWTALLRERLEERHIVYWDKKGDH